MQTKTRGLVETVSHVPGTSEAVWDRATSPEGINYELKPWLRMTVPKELRAGIPDDIEAPAHLGRSWILLFGIVPVEYDDIHIADLEPGRRFHEDSTMMLMRKWEHERIVRATSGGCDVTDRVRFEFRWPFHRVPGAYSFAGWIVGATFRHRHRRLRLYFS